MILNEFLNFRLGVEFEDKYNALAVKEVLENKEKYPLITDEIVNQTENAEDMGKDWDYDSGFFDCDDIELRADYDETMELYRAFVFAFAKDMKGKSIVVNGASFGLDYLQQADTRNVLHPFVCYRGMTFINVFPDQTELGKTIFYPMILSKEYLGPISTERYNRMFVTDNEEVLRKLAEGFKTLSDQELFFSNRFDNEGLAEHPVKLENGEVGYPYDSYELRIGENLLRFFSTERGFDALSALRFPILESLTEEQRANDVVKTIESIC